MSWWNRSEHARPEAPRWSAPPGEAVRVLVEHRDPAVQQVLGDGLRTRGYEVLTCGGPRAAGDTEVSCPLLRQEHCPAVDGADAVVTGLPIANLVERMVVRRVVDTRGGGSVIVEAPSQDAERYLGDLDVAARIWPMTIGAVANAVDEVQVRSGV